MGGGFLFGLALSTFAGLATGIGSLIALSVRRANPRALTLAMGFSAGVMIYVSFVELLPMALGMLEKSRPEDGQWVGIGALFGGMALIALIDRLVPSAENPHEFPENGQTSPNRPIVARAQTTHAPHALWRLGLATTIVLGLHNFPEGIATLLGGMQPSEVGIGIALAVAIHNIPEGIAVAMPIYYATGSRRQAFLYSFLSGLAEPVGAVVGYAILLPFLNDTVFGVLFAGIAGIMIFISLDQLLPAAERYGEHHYAIYGVLAGMAVMAVSLLLL